MRVIFNSPHKPLTQTRVPLDILFAAHTPLSTGSVKQNPEEARRNRIFSAIRCQPVEYGLGINRDGKTTYLSTDRNPYGVNTPDLRDTQTIAIHNHSDTAEGERDNPFSLTDIAHAIENEVTATYVVSPKYSNKLAPANPSWLPAGRDVQIFTKALKELEQKISEQSRSAACQFMEQRSREIALQELQGKLSEHQADFLYQEALNKTREDCKNAYHIVVAKLAKHFNWEYERVKDRD